MSFVSLFSVFKFFFYNVTIRNLVPFARCVTRGSNIFVIVYKISLLTTALFIVIIIIMSCR